MRLSNSNVLSALSLLPWLAELVICWDMPYFGNIPRYLFICALLAAIILLFSHNRHYVQISHCFLIITVSLCVLAVLLILSFFHNRSTHWLLWCIPFLCYDVLFLLLTRKSHPK